MRVEMIPLSISSLIKVLKYSRERVIPGSSWERSCEVLVLVPVVVGRIFGTTHVTAEAGDVIPARHAHTHVL